MPSPRVVVFAVLFSVVHPSLFCSAQPAAEPQPVDNASTATAALSTDDAAEHTEQSTRPILIRTQLVEVSLSKMRRLGVDFAMFDGNEVAQGSDFMEIAANAEPFVGFLQALRQHGIARILAAPSVTTLPGQRAFLSVGSTVDESGTDADDKREETFRKTGTKLQIDPQLVNGNRVRIGLNLCWTRVENQPNADQNKAGNVRSCEIDTTVETALGSTIVLARSLGEVEAEVEPETIALVVLVTPELATGSTSHQRPAKRMGQFSVCPANVRLE